MMINKKGQAGILSFILAYITLFIVWVIWAHELLSYWGEQAIIKGSVTGVNAFLLGNMNLWVFLGFILGLILIIYVGSNN